MKANLIIFLLVLYNFNSKAQTKEFEGRFSNNTVILTWQSAVKSCSNYFEIERSPDIINFKTVGLALDGIIDSRGDKSFAYKDQGTNLPGNSILYYRLKGIGMDGQIKYSTIIHLKSDRNESAYSAITK